MRSFLVSLATTLVLLVVIIALVIVPIALTQPDPIRVIGTFVAGPLSKLRYIGNIAEMAAPNMLCGLAVAIIFRSGNFNLGVEGSFFIGALTAAATALLVPLPGFLLVPTAILLGMVVGSSVCVAPGFLKAKFGSSELVSSLMLNFVALYIGLFVLNTYLRDPSAGSMVSFKIPADAKLGSLVSGTRIHIGCILAPLMCALGAIYVFRTRIGLESSIVGASPTFAAHLGLPIISTQLRAQLLGGLIAAGAGALELLGLYQRFSWQSLPGNGWSGVVVAILARDNPLLVIPAALFLAYLQVAGDLLARSFDVPSDAVGLMQALILLTVTASALVRSPHLKTWLKKRLTKTNGASLAVEARKGSAS